MHYSQETTVVGVYFLINLQTFRAKTLFKKRLQHRCFPVSFAKFSRTAFLTEHLWCQLLFHRIKTLKNFAKFTGKHLKSLKSFFYRWLAKNFAKFTKKKFIRNIPNRLRLLFFLTVYSSDRKRSFKNFWSSIWCIICYLFDTFFLAVVLP